eukprot:GFUD01028892.1.p1 GENE.GFUD01028892.1~~GFUD01028892.1.p1  ORF type:complete len:235 (+),score=96.67 GFUD01028892.1:131-835(+)
MASDKATKEEVEQAFAKADKDGNGKLTMSEFKVCLLEVMKDEDDGDDEEGMMDLVMSGFDTDGDKMVSLDELLKGMGDEKVDASEMFMINMIKGADKDGNGFINAAELKAIMEAMKDEDDDDDEIPVEFIMNLADADGDKKLSIQELVNAFTGKVDVKKDPKEKMKSMFRMCDTDDDGMITKKDIVKFLKMMGMVDEDDTPADVKMIVNLFMASADEDGDGKLSYEEFCKVMDD